MTRAVYPFAARLARASRRGEWLVTLGCGLLCGVLLAFPTLLDRWALILLLIALAPTGVVIHLRVARRSGAPRRVLGPLALFSLVFVGVLVIRALPLVLGSEGRYFALGDGGAIAPVQAVRLLRDLPELGSTLADPRVTPAGTRARLVVDHGGGAIGRASLSLVSTGGVDTRVEVELPAQSPTLWIPVTAGEQVAGALAVRPDERHPTGSVQLLARFFGADGRPVRDGGLAPRAELSELGPGWTTLRGAALAPAGSASAELLLELRLREGDRAHRVGLDAPLLVGGVPSTRPYEAGSTLWADAFDRALAIAAAMLAAIFAGYLLPWGDRVGRRVPGLPLPALRDRRAAWLIIACAVVGLVAWAFEMRSYGGYGGYLDALRTLGESGLGRWYLHAFAGLPTGIAVLLLCRWVDDPSGGRVRPVELAVCLLGTAIAFSYWLKAAVAIPLLTVLLFLYVRRQRAGIGLWVSGALFALATPFVYLVRGEGGVHATDLVSRTYWSDFLSTLSSRFFHFESLMITVPFESSEAPWRPFVDFFVTIVPRVLWDDKPLSAAARFTDAHLVPGLHTPQDVGVISLPGEAWLLGGSVGVVVVGVLLGIVLRLAYSFTRASLAGTLLIGSALTTFLLFLNDGWGLASALVQMLIASAGWIVVLVFARWPSTRR